MIPPTIYIYLTPFQLIPFFKSQKVPFITKFSYNMSSYNIDLTYTDFHHNVLYLEEFITIFSKFPYITITGITITTDNINHCTLYNIFQRLQINKKCHKLQHLTIKGFTEHPLNLEGLNLCPNLKTLFISDCYLKNYDLKYLTNLRTLDMHSSVSTKQINFIKCKKLRKLKLPFTEPDHIPTSSIQFTNLTTKIRELTTDIITHSPITYPNIYHISLHKQTKFPSAYISPNQIKSLHLTQCTMNIKFCPNLEHITLTSCNTLTNLKFLIKCTKLKSITFRSCNNLIVNAKVFDKCTNLKKVSIHGCCTFISTNSWKNYNILEELDIDRAYDFQIRNFINLNVLKIKYASTNTLHSITNATKLKEIALIFDPCHNNPIDLTQLEKCINLEHLTLKFCNFSSTASFEKNINLQTLKLDTCSIHISIINFSHNRLRHITINKCSVSNYSLKNCNNLESVIISHCPILKNITNINSKYLEIAHCNNITHLLNLGCDTTHILHIHNLKNLYFFTLAKTCTYIRSLTISHCDHLLNIHGISTSTNLKHVTIKYCPTISDISGLEKSTNISKFKLYECNNIKSVNLNGCHNIKELTLMCCASLKYAKILDYDIPSKLIYNCPQISAKPHTPTHDITSASKNIQIIQIIKICTFLSVCILIIWLI